jgi:outer membrane autotransporter protein
MILVYRLTLPTYVDSMALESALDTGSPLVATAWNHTLNLARLASRDIGGHLAALRIGESGQRGFSAFAGGNWAKLDDDARGNYAGYKADGWTATGGVDYTFDGKVTLGLAASKVEGDADVNGGWGRVEASGAGVSGFLSVDLGHVFFEAFYGHNELDYDLARNTGAYGLKATASTKGSTDALGGTVGWKGRLGNFQYTLDGGVDRMSGDIDSFTEAGAMHLNLLVPALSPRSTQWHASAQLAQEFTVNTWRITPYLAAESRQENDSESQPFTLTLANRATVSGASITGGTPVRDDKFWECRVGLVAAVTDRIGATIEAAKTFSNDDSAQHSVRFSVNYRF